MEMFMEKLYQTIRENFVVYSELKDNVIVIHTVDGQTFNLSIEKSE